MPKRPRRRLKVNQIDQKRVKTNQNRTKRPKRRPKLTQNYPKQAKTVKKET